MKKFLAIFLILCLCLGALAACDEPSSGPGGIPPAGGETPGGETPGSGNTNPGSGNTNPGGGNTNPGGGNTNPGGGNTNPGGGNTNPGSGNTNPGGGNTNPGGGNTNPGGVNTTPPAPDSNARTTVTEEEFEAAKAGNFQNYTMWVEMIFSNGEKFDGYAVDYINYVDGKLVFYAEEMTEGKKTGRCGFFHDGKYWCGSYDTDTGKWTVYSNNGYSISYPAADMPVSLSSLTYDEAKGEYRVLMEDADQMMTPEQIADGWGNITLRFEDGKLVKMIRPMKIDETKGMQYYVLTIGNYGTTVPPTPPMEDVVFNDTNGSISPDYNGGNTNEDLPPSSSDKKEESDNNNNNNNDNNDEDKDAPSTDDKTVTVWVSIEDGEYHKDSTCGGKQLKSMSLKRAEHEGYHPCKLCN